MLATFLAYTHLMPVAPYYTPTHFTAPKPKMSPDFTKYLLLWAEVSLLRSSRVTDLEVGLGTTEKKYWQDTGLIHWLVEYPNGPFIENCILV